MQNNFSTEDLLAQFRILKQSDVDIDEFYTSYLQACSLLCKSYFSLVVEFLDSNNTEIKSSYNNPSELFISKSKELSTKAFEKGFAYERYENSDTNYQTPYIVIFRNYNQNTLISLLIDKTIANQFNEMLVRTQLVCDTPNVYLNKNDIYTKNELVRQENSLNFSDNKNPLELFNIVIHKDNFDLALLTLVNELAFRFNCSQVSIGWLETNKIVTKAISSIERFEKNSDTITFLEDYFEECSEQNETLTYPNEDKSLASYECKKYYEYKKVSQVVAIPIEYKNRVCGVLVCEKMEDELSLNDIDLLKLSVNQISPWIISLQEKQEAIYKKVGRKTISFFENTLSIKYTGLKLVLAALLFLIVSSFFIKIDYKIDGIASVETDFITYVSAPYDGMIEDIKIKEGDDVLKDELLLTLDINELKLKANESSANIIRYTQESEKARANNSLADMKISISKKEEAKVALQRIDYYISQSKIKAPYDGIVVEGDHTKLLGAPVSKGDVMLKIAKIGSMYLKIKVNEKDIDNIESNGKFIFLTRADKVYDIKIDKIIPIAEVDKNEGNIFVVKALIEDKQQLWWRPGMSGVAKLDAGEKTLFWIATHKLVDFFRIYLWW